jgi:maleylacetoacetate isomerase
MTNLILHNYYRSSTSYRARIALEMKGLTYEYVPHHLRHGDHLEPAYRAVNPQALVPALILSDGTLLTQSLAIIEYLADVRPQCGLLPLDSADRQQVRALAYAIAMDIHPVCNLHVAAHVMSITGKADAREEWMKHFIPDGLRKLEAMLEGSNGEFSLGDVPTMADLCLVPQVYNARRWGVDMTNFKRIVDIDCKCAELPAFQAAHPDRVKP